MAEKNICKRQNAWTFFLSKLRLWIGVRSFLVIYNFGWQIFQVNWISLNTFKYKWLFMFTEAFHSVTKSTTRFSRLLALFQPYANSDNSFSNMPRRDQFRLPSGFCLIRTWISWKLPGASLIISLLITKKTILPAPGIKPRTSWSKVGRSTN